MCSVKTKYYLIFGSAQCLTLTYSATGSSNKGNTVPRQFAPFPCQKKRTKTWNWGFTLKFLRNMGYSIIINQQSSEMIHPFLSWPSPPLTCESLCPSLVLPPFQILRIFVRNRGIKYNYILDGQHRRISMHLSGLSFIFPRVFEVLGKR